MKEPTADVILSGINLDLTPALKAMATEKLSKLFAHEERIRRIRVELAYSQNVTHQDEFTASGHIEIRPKALNVSATSNDLYKSIDDLVHKLDRMLRRRARMRVAKRKRAKPVDLPADLPKVPA